MRSRISIALGSRFSRLAKRKRKQLLRRLDLKSCTHTSISLLKNIHGSNVCLLVELFLQSITYRAVVIKGIMVEFLRRKEYLIWKTNKR